MSVLNHRVTRWLIGAAALALLWVLATPAFASAAPTVVSLQWDDGTADQYQVQPMLQSHGMTGTFFINSGRTGTDGYMSLSQIQSLAAAGNEIGGHTVSHADLPTLSTDEAARQICNDRVTLLGDGFQVSDFAYPYGDYNSAVEQIAAGCGYNSARTIGGIFTPESCNGCDYAEAIPPGDPYATQTPDSIKATQSLSEIEGLVTQAERHGGGWVQLVMHHVCDGCDPTYAISPSTLSGLLDWLQGQVSQNAITVKTVNQVIGGAVKPGVPGPTATSAASGNLLQNPSLETVSNGTFPDCWQLGGYNSVGTGTVTSDAHSGSNAANVSITSYSGGDERLLSKEDLGGCAPTPQAGHSYTFSTWYHSDSPVRLVAYLRGQSGAWDFWAQSPNFFPASSGYTQASWTTPPVPASGTFGSNGLTCPCGGIGVAVSLRQVGSFTADDLNLSDSDTTPPTVTLNTPVDGQTVSGNVTLSASASDAPLPSGQPDGIRQVDFLVNGQIIGSSTTAPYQITWNSSGYTGARITARATDASGNIATSAPATVTVDNTAPQSKASAPASSPSNTIDVGYTATDDQGGSGLAEVDLYAKGPADSSYSKVASDVSGNGSGTFAYTASEGNGTYNFYTRASDKAGNVEAAHAVPDSSTVVQNGQLATAQAPSLTNSQSISVAFTVAGNGDPSALTQVDLYAKGPGDSTYAKVATDSTGQSSGSFTYAAVEGDGAYSFYALATDRQGNVQSAPPSPDSSTRVDTASPQSQASSAAFSGTTAITVAYTAADNAGGSGLARVDLYAKGPNDSTYSKAASDASGSAAGAFTYNVSEGDGSYGFYAVATDKAGNVQSVPSNPDAQTLVDTVAPGAKASVSQNTHSAPVTVAYSAGDNNGGSGIAKVDLYAQAPGSSTYSKVASDPSGQSSGSFSYAPASGNGTYSFYALATDKAGNVQTPPSTPNATTSYLADSIAPGSKATAPSSASTNSWSVGYTASDNAGGSGLASIELWVKTPGGSGYMKALTSSSSATSGSFSYTASAGDGTYSFYTVAVDVAGNREAAPSTPDASTALDTGAPSPFTMNNPGVYLHGTVSFSLASAPTDAGSGVKTVAYQYRPSGTGGTWTTACSATAAPWSCKVEHQERDGRRV